MREARQRWAHGRFLMQSPPVLRPEGWTSGYRLPISLRVSRVLRQPCLLRAANRMFGIAICGASACASRLRIYTSITLGQRGSHPIHISSIPPCDCPSTPGLESRLTEAMKKHLQTRPHSGDIRASLSVGSLSCPSGRAVPSRFASPEVWGTRHEKTSGHAIGVCALSQ